MSNRLEFPQIKTAAVLMVVFGVITVFAGVNISAQSFTENFDVVPVPGWTTQNNSTTIGTTGWYQGNTARFPAHLGPANSYVAVDTNSTTATNTISNWMVSPQRTFNNGDVIKFWTRTLTSTSFPDRLQLRLSLAGASTNVGTGPTAVGDFTTLLRDINPTYTTFSYPTTWTEFTVIVSGLSAPTSGRLAFRYFVENGGPTGPRSNYIGIDTFSYTAAADIVPGQHVSDYNGDGKTDFALVRNTGGGPSGQITWFININGSNTTYASAWGITSDAFVPEDYDGDGKTDIAVWRGGAPTVAAFYILQSETGTVRIAPFGQSGDDPSVVGDYDGDGKADIAVYRAGANSGEQSTWYFRGSLNNPSGNVSYVPWGLNGDFPGPGDYDGDGKYDFVVQRTVQIPFTFAQFWMLQTTAGVRKERFGNPTDQIAPGDYDGDGKTDLAVVRSVAGQLRWYYWSSQNGSINFSDFGISSTDFPSPGDYDGDGKTDLAVWRPSATPGASAFWAKGSTFGPFSVPFGAATDYPPANFNVH
ncbi:MAG TPA: choice-of-anchor J domain-containing protein [Pyrinomonadaceae bacterium]|nr:choice-of-anchor J domain-containing protein [Pyrinomonadaceae bacterium]